MNEIDGMRDDEDDRVGRRQPEQDGRVLDHHAEARGREHDEPQHHDRAEEDADLARPEPLDGEEADQDHRGDRDDQVRRWPAR